MTDRTEPDRELVFQPYAGSNAFVLVDPGSGQPWPFDDGSPQDSDELVVTTQAGAGFL